MRALLFFANIPVEPGEETILKSDVPELPNFVNLIYEKYHSSSWATFLHYWENIIFSVLVAAIISLIFYFGTRKKAQVPSGLQNFLELATEILQTWIKGVLGPQGDRYLPFLGTLFVYILSMNWFGLIPLMKSPSASLSITAAQAICVFVVVQYFNIKNMGFFGFLYHLAGSPKGILGWTMAPLLFPLELITQISRPITLSLRLCGNMLGEHTLIGAFALLGFMLLSSVQSPVGVPLQLPFLFLGLLTSLMQALVFTLLTTVYILLSVPTHSEHQHT